jgi:hypothetical protein
MAEEQPVVLAKALSKASLMQRYAPGLCHKADGYEDGHCERGELQLMEEPVPPNARSDKGEQSEPHSNRQDGVGSFHCRHTPWAVTATSSAVCGVFGL